jgi:bifunctional non-homologous end joining protein LigD
MKERTASSFSFIEPMKALRVPELPSGNWLYEMKFDGYRALAFKAGREVRLVSRNRKDFGDDYPLLLDALRSLIAKSFVIDGEIAALDQNGRSSFQLLQSYGIRKNIPLVYYAFDLLSLEGTDVRDSPLLGRRKLLATLLKNAPANVRFSEELQGTRDALLEIAHKFGLEGLVAKRPDSRYESGRRSGAWVKVKITQQQEFVIGGYTPPEGSRMYFGSLLSIRARPASPHRECPGMAFSPRFGDHRGRAPEARAAICCANTETRLGRSYQGKYRGRRLEGIASTTSRKILVCYAHSDSRTGLAYLG